MLVVGVTGGIGAGKSALTAMLQERGAAIIDADEIGRRALDPGTPAWHSVVDTFGNEILAPPGMEIDRKHLGRIVFESKERLAALNAIVHPVILSTIADALESFRGTDEIVVLDAALIIELDLHKAVDVLVVVVSAEGMRTARLSQDRAMDPAEAEARIRSQISPEEAMELADIVVVNEGSMADLEAEADRVWAELCERNAAKDRPDR